MRLTLIEVNEIFQKLINTDITREEADEWAYARIQALDINELEFSPLSDEKKLWSAIQYLYGIDIKVAPCEYMHSLDDIKVKFESEYKLQT